MAISTQSRKQEKRKGGRPRQAVSSTAVLVVRMTPEERKQVEQKAKAAGVKTGAWFRMAAKSAVIQARFTPEEIGWWRSLAGLSNNLNQLTRLAHREGLLYITGDIRKLLDSIASIMDQIKKDDRKTH